MTQSGSLSAWRQWLVRWRWGGGVMAALVGVFLIGVAVPGAWFWMGVDPVRPLFQDFAAVLASGEAWVAGEDPYVWGNPFDLYGRPHGYGPWWLWLGTLGLTAADWPWVGSLVNGTFALCAIAVLKPCDRLQAWYAGLLLVSPPILLGLERANNDLLIFVMAVVVVSMVARGGWGELGVATALLVAATVLKFYPLALFPVLLMARRGGRALGFLVTAVFVLGFVVAYWWVDFQRGFAVMPVPNSMYTYGLKSTYNAWNSELANRGALIVGLVIGVAGSLWAVRRAWPRDAGFGRTMEISPEYAIGALGWCSCYLINANFLYRYVLLLFPAAQWLRDLKNPDRSEFAKVQLILMIIMADGWIPWMLIARTTQRTDAWAFPFFWMIGGIVQGVTLVLTGLVLFYLIKGALSVARRHGVWPLEMKAVRGNSVEA